MKKRVFLILIIIFCLFINPNLTVLATSSTQSAQEKKKQAENDLKVLNEQMQGIEQQQKELQNQMDENEKQLVNLLVNIDLIKEDMVSTEAELEEVRAELEQAKKDEKEQYEAMKLRIKYMYEQGDTAFLEAILESQSMADLLNQVEYYDEVYNYDRRLLVSYQETKLNCEQLEKDVEQELAELQDINYALKEEEDSLKSVMSELQSQLDDYDTKLANAQSMADSYKKTIIAQNNIIEEARRVQEEANNNSNHNSGTGGSSGGNSSGGSSGGGSSDGGNSQNPEHSTNVSASELIAYARSFIGNPYVWGGTDPHTGADCSGFTQYVYGHFGIHIGRTSGEQRYYGKSVSWENIQPGDLICYDGHVAIYAGNNRIIHARGARYGIGETSNPKYRPIVDIRRLL